MTIEVEKCLRKITEEYDIEFDVQIQYLALLINNAIHHYILSVVHCDLQDEWTFKDSVEIIERDLNFDN